MPGELLVVCAGECSVVCGVTSYWEPVARECVLFVFDVRVYYALLLREIFIVSAAQDTISLAGRRAGVAEPRLDFLHRLSNLREHLPDRL